MFTLTIIREPYESDNDTNYGEVFVYSSTEQCEIENHLKDYLRSHMYMPRTHYNEGVGDIMFIVTHNGRVVDHINMTNSMDFDNCTDTSSKPLTKDFSLVYDAFRKEVSKNDGFCTNIKLVEAHTKKNLTKRYELERNKELEIQRLRELMKKYPDEVHNGS